MNKWFCAYKPRGEDVTDLSGLTILEPPKGHYQADPFMVRHINDTYLFTELYDYDKGRLVVQKMVNGVFDAPVRIMPNHPHHMSFPAVFEDNGVYYMTPEEGATGELRIYRSRNFPFNWEQVCVVARGVFADPIMVKRGTTYQIHCTDGGDHYYRVYESYNITGPWSLTVARDEMDSRSAGAVYKSGDKWVRPVQNCTGGYGLSVLLKNIENGRVIEELKPDWYPGLTGFHTFNMTEDYVVVDGRIKIS